MPDMLTLIYAWCPLVHLSTENNTTTPAAPYVLPLEGPHAQPYLYSKIFFIFLQHTPMVYTKVSLYTLVVHTHKNFSTRIFLYTKKPFIHTFFLHICINKNLFLFFMNMTFIHNASFFLLGFLVHFTFRTTFLNEKFYAIPEFQQTLLTTTK